MGLSSSAQPVISYNYGARKPERVKTAIRFMSVTLFSYTFVAWGILYLFPQFFIRIFNAELVETGYIPMRIYFFGFYMMALQFVGQSVFTALGKAKHAIFFPWSKRRLPG